MLSQYEYFVAAFDPDKSASGSITMFIVIIGCRRIRVYPEFCVNVLRECKQQKLV